MKKQEYSKEQLEAIKLIARKSGSGKEEIEVPRDSENIILKY